jgi:DNA-binding PadR family transcriptional regulator
MIEHELLFLGLLREGPKHGYDIKIKIKEILSFFAGIDLKSIYYPLRVLEKRGLIAKRITRVGRRPARIVYYLTLKGKERFNRLLTESFLNFKRPQFSLDLSLYFLKFIKPDIARRRLRGRMRLLMRLAKGLHLTVNSLKKKNNPCLVYIMEHDRRMVETEYQFLAGLIKSL